MTPEQTQQLAALRERRAKAAAGGFARVASYADIDLLLTLLADAELRRSETVAMCEQLTAELAAATEAGERAEIVAWLRNRANELARQNVEIGGDFYFSARANELDDAADAIEAGAAKGGGDETS